MINNIIQENNQAITIKMVGVMKSSVYIPRQRNSPYRQTFRRSIYNTRWPKHPHYPILRYKQRHQGLPWWQHYMDYWQPRPELHLCILLHIQSIILWLRRDCHEHDTALRSHALLHLICCREPRHRNLRFLIIQQFLLDSTQGFWRDPTQFLRINLTQGFWLYLTQFSQLGSTHGFWQDLTHVFIFWIWIIFNTIVFD